MWENAMSNDAKAKERRRLESPQDKRGKFGKIDEERKMSNPFLYCVHG
jgi:hypothetical protein